jgi:Outer membrane lipoprotein-sorting protein
MLLFYTGRAIFVLAVLFGTLPLGAQTLRLDQIISRMEQAQSAARERSVLYSVTRQYTLSGDDTRKPNSEVLAEIDFVPPAQSAYSIRKVQGSERGEKIVRRVLEHESQMATHPERYELSPRNYDFALLGREMLDGHDCYLLELKPRHQAPEVLRGKAWVDTRNFLVRKLEGEPAKSPSWWIKDLHVIINYSEVNGVWLQSDTRAVADVRFAGTRIFTARNIDVRTATENAQSRPASRNWVRRSSSRRGIADSAVWVAR